MLVLPLSLSLSFSFPLPALLPLRSLNTPIGVVPRE